jgi:hypothetical protein
MVWVFHGFTKAGTLKRKDHAQDCETLSAKISRSQRPAILPWSLGFEWRPSFRWYGHHARYTQPPDCDWIRRADLFKVHALYMHDRIEKGGNPLFRIMRKRARDARVTVF